MKEVSVVKEIQIQNVRSLKDTGLQKLSPITVLVGENSSGKSTFLRMFPLMKQSISKRTSGPILWAGDIDDYVDFGSFKETVTNDNSNYITIRFSFNLNTHNFYHRYFMMAERKAMGKICKSNVDYALTIKSDQAKDFVSKWVIKISGICAEFDFENKSVAIDGTVLYNYHSKHDNEQDDRSRREYHSLTSHSAAFGFSLPDINELWDELETALDSNGEKGEMYERALVQGAIIEIFGNLERGEKISHIQIKDKKKRGHRVNPEGRPIYNKLVDIVNDAKNERLTNIIKICFIYCIFDDMDEYINIYFRNVHYIAPLRATAERYYRLRNLAVDEVDFQGKNLAIFINSLPRNRLLNFQQWTNQYFGFSVQTGISDGHISLKIKLKNSDKAINLSDTGFGYSQVLPIITQLWELSSKKQERPEAFYVGDRLIPLVIAIEQPELHLHPGLQAKLAKAFIACIDLAKENGRELQLILETHSETIISYLGRAISRGQISQNDVSIILFERDLSKGSTNVQNSQFDKDGCLNNWPYGFFDAEE